MRDQPFKKYFPNQPTLAHAKSKSPTIYKHYYENKYSKIKDVNQNKSQPKIDKKSEPQNREERQSQSIVHHHQGNKKISLKTQLQNLKLQVFKVMQKRQIIFKNTIQTKLSSQNASLRSSHMKYFSNDEEFDTQSVTSEKVINQPLRKIQLKKSTENYDHAKYIQLENNILRTQLKNLKNKYVSKKRELSQKSDGLEKKIIFLEEALSKSEQKLTVQVNYLKQSLKKIQSSQKDERKDDQSIKKQDKSTQDDKDIQSKAIKQKLKQLYQQISLKNAEIQSNHQKIQNYQKQNTKLKKQLGIYIEKFQSKQDQLIQQQQINEQLQNSIASLNDQMMSLKQIIQNYKNNNNKIASQIIEDSSSQKYLQKITKYQEEIKNYKNTFQNMKNQKILFEEESTFNSIENNKLKSKIQQLNNRIKLQNLKCTQIQQKYEQIIKMNDNKYETLIKNLKNQHKNKVFSSSSHHKKSSPQNISVSNKTPSPVKNKEDQSLTKELKKWKLQYKILKERYELFNKNTSNHRDQMKQYYKIAKQSKQKIEILTKKNKLFEKEFQKLKNMIKKKQNDVVKNQVDMRKISHELSMLQKKNSREAITFTDKYKLLQQKLTNEQAKFQKEQAYRKQLQQKLLSLPINNEEYKEIIQRLKKRLNQQDEKISKNLKELKTKDTLMNKLKQQLRELLQNIESKSKTKVEQELQEFKSEYFRKQNEMYEIYCQKNDKQIQILSENNNKLLSQLQQFKLSLNERQNIILQMENQLKQLSLSYNTKNVYIQEIITEKNQKIYYLQEEFQEYKNMKIFSESVFNEEMRLKNEEINILRNEVINKSYSSMPNLNFNVNFDEILKNQIENSNKLRQENTKKSQEMYKLRDNYTTLKSQYENLKSENQINKLRFYSEKKNLDISYQVEIQNYQNQQANLQNKIGSIEKKIQVLIDQNKKKDNFIQQYIIGKKINQKQKQILNDFIKQYSICIGSTDIVERLMGDYRQIQRISKYNVLLLKEISLLKEKIVLYQVLDVDKVSLYESKMSASHQSYQSFEKIDSIEQLSPGRQTFESKLKKTISMQDFTMQAEI